MENEANINLNSLYNSILIKEKKARRRVIIYTIIPILIGFVWLLWTAREVGKLEKEAIELNVKIIESQQRVLDLETRLSEANKFVGQSINLTFMDIKLLYSQQPRVTAILSSIFELKERGVKFRLGGRDPNIGFDSPSMMNYVLYNNRYLSSNSLSKQELRNQLERTNVLKSGDIIFYKTGYVMLYVEQASGLKYCIGMTPFGVLVLKKDFAEIDEIRRINYR
ncbi:MAG: hypothetical protein RO257_04975 [Candidatus Kapabacteria bacterium]|nr:hypothetical protein [Candidatus Kapabacteria bacterium]